MSKPPTVFTVVLTGVVVSAAGSLSRLHEPGTPATGVSESAHPERKGHGGTQPDQSVADGPWTASCEYWAAARPFSTEDRSNHPTTARQKDVRCDNGPELTSRHFLAWSIERKIDLVHIQPGKPTQNARVESFNGRLREECLRVSWFQNLFDATRKISLWRRDYNEQRPHSSLKYLTPVEFAAEASRGKDAGCACLENADGVSHFPTATAAAG